jgi:hypothetical protein
MPSAGGPWYSQQEIAMFKSFTPEEALITSDLPLLPVLSTWSSALEKVTLSLLSLIVSVIDGAGVESFEPHLNSNVIIRVTETDLKSFIGFVCVF